MIQSLSDKQRHKRNKTRRVVLVTVTITVLLLWTFLRPLFLTIADPVILFYSNVSGTLYTKYQKVQAFFVSKDKTLSYVRALEEENSRLHNKLSLLENNNCTSDVPLVTTIATPLVVASTTTSSSTMTLSPSANITDPCALTLRQQKENTDIDFLRVSPVLSHLSFLFDTIRINRGATDGLEEGDVVFTRGMVVIGKVLSVSKHSSLVELYSKQGIESYGTLASGDSFKMIGTGGGSYEALIPKDISITKGEKILFTWDQDLILGEVADIVSEKQDVSQKVSIRGGFSPSKLPVMYIKNHE